MLTAYPDAFVFETFKPAAPDMLVVIEVCADAGENVLAPVNVCTVPSPARVVVDAGSVIEYPPEAAVKGAKSFTSSGVVADAVSGV